MAKKSSKFRLLLSVLVVSSTLSILSTGVLVGAKPANAKDCVPASAPIIATTAASKTQPPSVSVSWRPSSGNGTPIDRYVAALMPAAQTTAPSANQLYYLPSSSSVAGLTTSTISQSAAMSMKWGAPIVTLGGSYVIKIAAHNSCGISSTGMFGYSEWSQLSGALTPAIPASAPRNVSASSDNGFVTVSWSPPSSSGFSTITGYTVTATPSGKGCITSSGAETSCSVTGLTNGASYAFSVRAQTAAGLGATSALSPLTKVGLPKPPTNVTAIPGNASATVSWTAPTGGGAPGHFLVTSHPDGRTCTTSTSTATSCSVSGLANGTAYTFTVQSVNSYGMSTASAPSGSTSPSVAPGAPTAVNATAGVRSAQVAWTAPVQVGSGITGYVVTSSPDGKTCTTTTSTTCTVSGLNNGTSYTFTVQASNAVTHGPNSASSTAVTTPNVPDAPGGLNFYNIGTGSASVSWGTPNNHGSAIQYYAVSYCGQVGGTSCSISGLYQSTGYSVCVYAVNAVGSGAQSCGSFTTATPPPSVSAWKSSSASNKCGGCYWVGVQVHNFPTGYFSYSCNDSSGQFYSSHVTVSDPNQSWSTGLCYDSHPYAPYVVINGVGSNAAPFAITLVSFSRMAHSSQPRTALPKPNPPKNVVVTAGIASVKVSWLAPTGGGLPGHYLVTAKPGGRTCVTTTSTTLNCTVTGLTNGTTYTFTVQAANASGISAPSVASRSVTPSEAPGSPTGVSAVPSATSVQVSWTVPTQVGSGITGYVATVSPGGRTCSTTTLNCTITGLTGSTTYSICVVASNAVAHSPLACTSVTTSSSGAPSPSVSVWKSSSASDHCGGCYWLGVQVHNFPIGTFAFACFDTASPSPWYRGTITISDPNQSWSTGLCYDSHPYVPYVVINGVNSNTTPFAAPLTTHSASIRPRTPTAN